MMGFYFFCQVENAGVNILDYDQTNLRLRVVDSGFLIWLNRQNRTDLLANIGK
jgi:hypothetical protein